ncbi:uncharacterized protein LOC143289012 [Babylonia areolata]|uniref:uncharacterized protein LOC143289012 n=1 Tax=Babylonia areolata TaxID=304850 RepID=UPI003FD27AC4
MASVMKTRVGELDGGTGVLHPSEMSKVPPARLVIDRDAVSTVERILGRLGQLQVMEDPATVQAMPFSFHCSHGDDIVLSSDGQEAEKDGNMMGGGILISRQPMEINHLYQIEVKHLQKRGAGLSSLLPLLPGVVCSSPDQLTSPLPDQVYGWESAIVVGHTYVNNRGKEVECPLGSIGLGGVAEGSRVGVSLDGQRNLRLHRDGRCLGVVAAASSVPQPAFALFALQMSCKYWVVTCPVTPLQ